MKNFIQRDVQQALRATTPINFFQLSVACKYLPQKAEFPSLSEKIAPLYLLPNTSSLCYEERFADVSMGWNALGLEFCFQVEKPVENVSFPDIERGDSIEVFIDTRDVKTSGYNTRFCHHFFALPALAAGRQTGELTHFRTEDAHGLCAESRLHVKAKLQNNTYTVYLRIPKECLIGFDPEQFDRLGFSYRINRPRGESQHFSAVSSDYQISQQPSLWSHMKLIS